MDAKAGAQCEAAETPEQSNDRAVMEAEFINQVHMTLPTKMNEFNSLIFKKTAYSMNTAQKGAQKQLLEWFDF